MDKRIGTPPSLEEKKALPNCGNKDGNIKKKKVTKYLHGTQALLNIILTHTMLAIATNIHLLLMTVFLLQGHI